jgi:hypothetical protein
MSEEQPETPAEVDAARTAFLAEPPEFVPTEEPVDDAAQAAADEAAALDEQILPPAADTTAVAPAAEPTPGTPDPYEQYGGAQAVQNAWQVQEALKTEQGVRALVANGLVALGYTVEQVREALDAAAAGTAPVTSTGGVTTPAADDPFAGLDDDDVVTVGSIKSVIDNAVAQATAAAQGQTQQAVKPLQDVIAEQQASTVRQFTDAALLEVLGPYPAAGTPERATYDAQIQDILARGAAYYDPTAWNNPEHLRSVVQRASAEIHAENERRYQAYLTTKRQARDSAPPNIGGGAGGDGPLAEPKSLGDARKQLTDSGFFK